MRSYGTISLDGRRWAIECEPQVAIRLKRVFKQIDKNEYGQISLSATPAQTRELSWFIQRYPMELEDGDRTKLEELAEEHRQHEDLVADILAKDYVAPDFSEMQIRPRDYQRIAADLVMKTKALLIADDLGLGKSITAICAFTDPSNLPALVVTMSHLPKQWEKEINRCLPNLRTHILKKGTPYDLTKGKHGEKILFPDVIITNYHKLSGWAETLAGVVRSCSYDECQELRRSESHKYSAAKHISSLAALNQGMSATPIFGYGGEIHNVMDVIAPDALGTRDEFIREWCSTFQTDKPKIRDPKAFGSFMHEQGLMIRRTRAEVGRELKPLNNIVQEIEADDEALSAIEDSAAELAKIILSQNKLKKGVKMHAAEELSNVVRQATGLAKAVYVADFVRLIVEQGEPVLLFAWHRSVYEVLNAKLKDLNPVMYTGSETAQQKEAAKQKFTSGESKILMMSLRSGAGLDGLQFMCRTIIFAELDWAPGVHSQASGRVHRDGQIDPVMAYYLIAAYGSDPPMMDVLGVKRQQLEGIINPNAALIEATQNSGPNIRQLAESFLKQRGIAVTEPKNLADIIQLDPEEDDE